MRQVPRERERGAWTKAGGGRPCQVGGASAGMRCEGGVAGRGRGVGAAGCDGAWRGRGYWRRGRGGSGLAGWAFLSVTAASQLSSVTCLRNLPEKGRGAEVGGQEPGLGAAGLGEEPLDLHRGRSSAAT